MTWANWIFWLTMNLYFEARGESLEGKVAVCHVVMNRTVKRRKSVEEVIRESQQFSWYNGNVVPPVYQPMELIRCIEALFVFFGERMRGLNLSGADHYFNPYLVLPSWAKSMVKIGLIGNHEFYRSK